ncbi:MAG: MOSC domain-containing protein [Gemmatimonadales bacterium]
MRELGRVTRLQIQRAALKTSVKPKVYDPVPLLAVERLAVSADGCLDQAPDGSWLVDVHHRAHPETRNEDGRHGVSIGFSGHYQVMRERLGERITPGCAGENIIVDADRVVTPAELAPGLAIVGADGAVVLPLTVLQPAQPCRPFTGWALGREVPAETLKAALQFLDGGMRGYYCGAEGSGVVSLGDRLVLL